MTYSGKRMFTGTHFVEVHKSKCETTFAERESAGLVWSSAGCARIPGPVY